MRLGFLPLVIQPNWAYSESHAEDAASAFDLNTVPNSVWDMGGYQVPVAGDYLHCNLQWNHGCAIPAGSP